MIIEFKLRQCDISQMRNAYCYDGKSCSYSNKNHPQLSNK